MTFYNARIYVIDWLRQNNISIDERGSLIAPDNNDYYHIFDKLWLDYRQASLAASVEQQRRIVTVTETDLKKALDEFINNERLSRRNAIINDLRCTGESLDELKKFVLTLTGHTGIATVTVFAHLIWQMKRNMLGKEVMYHIMPILFGDQGAGKTVAVRLLLKPLKSMTLELNLSDLADPRFYFAFNENFAVILNEMAGAKRTDIDSVKRQITADYNDARRLGSNKVIKLKQNASIIGTTNRPVSELIFDPTGARRFFEIRILPKGQVDFAVLHSIDYLKLFRGIDESKERGYIEEQLEEVTKEQEHLIGQDELAAFIEHYDIRGGEENKEISAQDLYDRYKEWCESNGITRPDNAIWFGRRIKNRGITSLKRKLGGKSSTIYLVHRDSAIHNKSYDILDSKVKVVRDV